MDSDFKESVEKFQSFLETNGYPREVIWVTPQDVLLTNRRLVYVRLPVSEGNQRSVQDRFESAIAQERGVLFSTICEDENTTFAFVWVPEDKTAAEYAMMPRGLKMSVLTGASRTRGQVVRSRPMWFVLSLRYRAEQTSKDVVFFLR